MLTIGLVVFMDGGPLWAPDAGRHPIRVPALTARCHLFGGFEGSCVGLCPLVTEVNQLQADPAQLLGGVLADALPSGDPVVLIMRRDRTAPAIRSSCPRHTSLIRQFAAIAAVWQGLLSAAR